MSQSRFRGKPAKRRQRGPHRVSEPQSSAHIVEQVLGRLGGGGRITEHRVFDAYMAAVGPLLRSRSAPERLRGTTLLVHVESSAFAHELTMLKTEILAKVAEKVGPGVVTDLRTRVGEVSR